MMLALRQSRNIIVLFIKIHKMDMELIQKQVSTPYEKILWSLYSEMFYKALVVYFNPVAVIGTVLYNEMHVALPRTL